MLRNINEKVIGFIDKTTEEKLKVLMQDEIVLDTAKFLYDIYKLRQKHIYENVEVFC